jgi:hypothetical protein
MKTPKTQSVAAAAVVSILVGYGCALEEEQPVATTQTEDLTEVQMDCSINEGVSSFEEIRELVYGGDPGFVNNTYPWNRLPKRGAPLSALFDVITGGLSRDCSQIMQCSRDWRDNQEGHDKIIHAPGICASATWSIDDGTGVNLVSGGEAQPYTGLFASGTKVNTIVRLSTATNVVKPNPWTLTAAWSIGVKLFPAPADQPDTPVRTVNFAMFDQNGVAGTRSHEMLRPDDDGHHFFANWLYGDGFAARTMISTLDKFVKPHTHNGESVGKQLRLQALDSLALVTQDGQDVDKSAAHYPTVIKLQLAESVPYLDEVSDRIDTGWFHTLNNDFRKQLLAYNDGEIVFDIIADRAAEGPDALRSAGGEQRIGTLTLDRMVVSDLCDQDLTFQHSRNGEVFTAWTPTPDEK